VETLIKKTLEGDDPFIERINHYILSAKGKRLRPILTLLSSKIGSQIHLERKSGNPRVIPLAAALELIHTASLLPDDVIDEADLRRNQVSLNRKWAIQ